MSKPLKSLEEIQKQIDRWQSRYGCSLGKKYGWCDGKHPKTGKTPRRCPSAINFPDGETACELAI